MELNYRFTRHATQRIEEMLVSPEEVKACLMQPEKVWESKTHPGSMNRRRGRLTLGTLLVDDKFGGGPLCLVITAVWSEIEDWEADINAYGGYEGRTSVKQRRT